MGCSSGLEAVAPDSPQASSTSPVGGDFPVNALCGSADGRPASSAPSVNLCSSGNASAVSGTGPFSWTCSGINGGSNTSCSASVKTFIVTPSGANLSINPSAAQTVVAGTKQAFTVSAYSGNTLSKTVGGTCPAGIFNGAIYTTGAITADCTVIFSSSLAAVNGICGSANGVATFSAPTNSLCSTGAASSVSGSDPFVWTCNGINGGSNVSCSAPKTSSITYIVTPSGTQVSISPGTPQTVSAGAKPSFVVTANSGYTLSATAGGTCPIGSFNGSTYTTGTVIANCSVTFSASVTPMNGACGSANGSTTSTAPSTPTLCSAGTASAVSGSGPFAWTCSGSNGGTTAQCSASLPAPAGSVPQPGSSNRPVYNSASNTLSWSGPTGGGLSTSTYTKQTRTLIASGPVTSSAPGQIIEGLRITGSGALNNGLITVNHNNVTIRQNSLMETTSNQPDKYTIFIAQGVTGTIIEDNAIDGNALGGSGGTSCVAGATSNGPGVNGLIMRRNSCQRSEQAIRFVLNNVQFTENWCSQIGGTDADWVEAYPIGGTVDHLLIQYNTFDGTDNPQGGSDAGVNLTTGSGLPTGNIGPNISIDSNWFINWSTVHAVNFDNTSGGLLQFSFTNNGFYNFQDNISPSGTVSSNKGNYIMLTPTSLTGAPLHGTGSL